MFKKVFNLLKILRKLSVSGAVETLDKFKPVPGFFKFVIFIFSIGSAKKIKNLNKSPGEKLCNSLESMGPTFIKLGQFLATRPDIIGDEIAKNLEKLQDKLPAFNTTEAKKIIKREIGEKYYSKIKNISEPVAAASIAQENFAEINIDGSDKDLAIKILRPDIQKIFNEELDALNF